MHFDLEIVLLSGMSTRPDGTGYEMIDIDPQCQLALGDGAQMAMGHYCLLLKGPELETSMRHSRLYVDYGEGFLERDSCDLNVLPDGAKRCRAYFILARPARRLRLDPADRPGNLPLHAVRLVRLSRANWYAQAAVALARVNVGSWADALRLFRRALSVLKQAGIMGLAKRVRTAALLQRKVTSATAQMLKGGANPFDRRIYNLWIQRRDTLTSQDRIEIRESINVFKERPLISIAMPVYNTPESVLREAIASVRRQLYPHWELCIADDASTQPRVKELLAELAAEEPRIRWMSRESNGHISLASNSALELASGEFVALMDHDDLLAEHALYEIVAALQNNIDANIFYSDEDKIDERGERHDPYFKPAFSYEQMLGQNLISHLGVYRRSLLSKVGGFRAGFEGSQDYDLALRCIEHTKADKIVHVPEILYHWRQQSASASFSQTELDRCVAAARKALQEHLAKRADDVGTALIETNPIVPSWNRVRWPLPEPSPLVSIIIPTRDRADLLEQCVDGLLSRTAYENFEIIVVDNQSIESETAALFSEWTESENIRVYSVEGPFNYSRLNNEAVRIARGSILVLLNNDVDVIDSNWLYELVSLAIRPDIGCVGAKLLYADKCVQHAGVRLGAGHFDCGPGVAGHLGLFRSAGDPGYFGSFAIARDVGCVTAACLAVRKEIYEVVGGLDETNLAVAFNDVDFCLRVRSAGYRILWTPFAELFHLESASRGSDQTPENQARFHNEARYMRERWAIELDGDPFYSRHFNNVETDYELQMSPGRERSWHTRRSQI